MASIDRYRPAGRESYQPPSLPPKPPPPSDRQSRSPTRRHGAALVPPAAPSPPVHSSRNSPPRPGMARRGPLAASPLRPPATPAPKPRKNSQWFFTPDEIRSTPSIADGLRPADERMRRAKGVSFIYQAGVLLELPQITLWVAAVFFHRFFMRVSLVEEKGGVHHYNIAATSLFLANKTQEDCRKTKDLIISVARVAQKNANLIIDEQSKEYWRWRDSILMHEEIMLEILTFDLMVKVPYQPLFENLKELGLQHNKRLRDAAWAYLNDSCFSTLPLLMSAKDIAASAILFASATTGEKVEDINGEPWWVLIKADESRIVQAINVIVDFYTENPLGKKTDRLPGSPEFSLESTRRRGDTILSQQTDASSYNGTPMETDQDGTQSPGVRLNGKPDRDSSGSNSAGKEELRREPNGGAPLRSDVKGDSDAALKAAANDLDAQDEGLVSPNINDVASPSGTKRSGGASDADRDRKRARLSDEDEDEGEVPE
ncbi:hypothetical protein MCOR02_002047 [Pyricularia oryzae]|uniref:RNA polymerase II holoenzyme cyclin-like subunit n=3 Tax=Pyricularia oryzae TaxID=318829 RepID=G4MXN2_PYRO7|nr:cyclin-K [Pyricularia oryzae 70-15]ELQ42460.1 cyclin-K [Pyricularia oryzae Y34]KAH9438418.1 hypothetical protein MCOR02_002047 [Pyricularia oryzae]EHA54363.1 cyclin-K [Pyricularia oryzae 70-15]KAI6312497.1 hypothetical protein MCOR34_005611 [Pyricularia oryzae]KAI6447624.1 hypothetical protein MCOR17_010494 [Pyricularia oryzae]